MADKYYRLVCFVVDICADVLRKYFVKLAKTDAGNTYTSVMAYLNQRHRDAKQLLWQKKIRNYQYNLLFPSNGRADENQWDITLIVTLIVELYPSHENFALSEIRDIRNNLQHHSNTSNISDDEFDDYWGRLNTACMRIVNTCSVKEAFSPKDKVAFQDKISKAKCNNLPNIGDCLRCWYEERIKQMESTTEETNKIIRKVTVEKPGPSGENNKRFKAFDGILAKLRKGFELSMKDFPDDFNAPNEVTDIRAKLRDCHHVLVAGCNNSRYFETALAAIKGMDYNYKRSVEMHTSSDWRHIDPEDVDLVLCRDPFGGVSYDESKAKAMDDIFTSMMHSTKTDNGDKTLDIVIVTDLNILEECKMHHDHEFLDEVVKVFTDTSSTQPADLTIGCRRKGQYAQSSSLPVTRNNLGALTECFLKAYEISSAQVNDQILTKAKRSFQVYKAIVLTGHEKCGKTSIAVALASAYDVKECLLLKKPNDVNYIDFPNICLVIIDEFAGKYRYEENDVYKWYNMFDHLYNAVIAGHMNVIMTCEKRKLDKCINEIGRHAILDHVVDVPLQKAVVKLEVSERIQSQIQAKRGFSGLERVMQTETDDLSVKRSRSMSSGLWSAEEKREINIRIKDDRKHCDLSGSCILPSGEILLSDFYNKTLKKLDNMYKVISVCDLPCIPYDVCYVGDNVAVVSLLMKLQFVDTKRSMTLIRCIDTDQLCRGLACHGDQMYVRDINGSIYRYSTDGIKQQVIYSTIISYNPYNKITVSNDGSKLYFSCENQLVTIDKNGNHLFTLNNAKIHGRCRVCVDDQGYVYVNGRNGNILQISEDGMILLQVIPRVYGMTNARSLTFDRKNTALIIAGLSDEISVFKLRS
ncbi:uncharacterized protein LOC132715883 [Ruditapes philippinarum]|uniref:uncharacterized protein LOC132715883 n=1 Tax=Ruditapes philippinarum TaxID=129788 RepID=UPI00295B577F|nr:uncharacterized protein LOC132715883 [Ruditapes philippinarum]XP_060554960.1 uncharacterized protein LOC132715883 [Ruditapes philippinarum]XP_060554961.1 uncharacterized protein LOC132715883 [Ruditapes philippinarum]